jgi:hypothetical protein
MTKAELRDETKRRLAEAQPSVFWSDADVDAAVALGYQELSDASEWNELWIDITLLQDRPYYDLRYVIPDTLLSIKPCFDRNTNRWLIPSTVRELDMNDRRWERATDRPQRIFLRGLYWLGLFPRIQSDGSKDLKQYYTALPPPLVDEWDEPGFPDTFHMTIVDFAETDLWAQDGETTLATAAWGRYESGEKALIAWVQERSAVPGLHGFSSVGGNAYR